MTDLPGWIQEIRDRADKATPGPWEAVTYASVVVGPTCDMLDNPNARFLANARTDVPRLIELVGEMAGVLESVVCVCDTMNDVELPLHVGMEAARAHRAAQKVLAKYHGEVNKP